MPIQINSIISALDKPASLAPFFVKDAFDITGRTMMANNEGGKHEAREKAIEEVGTSLFWIGGIPAVRWLGGKLTKMVSKINPEIHFKRINTDGIQNYFADEIESEGKKKFSAEELKGINLGQKSGKLAKIKAALSKAGDIPNVKKMGTFKAAHIAITATAVLTNLAILSVGLPKFNQYLSRKIISKEHKDALNKTKEGNKIQPNSDEFLSKTPLEKDSKNIKFGGFKDLTDVKSMFNFVKMAENAQLELTSSMLLLDYGISGSRVTFLPRDNNERIENVIKEGGIIIFFYKAGEWIKEGLANLADKTLKTPIDLDYKIITDKNFVKLLKGTSDKAKLFEFAKSDSEIDIIKFIDSELEGSEKITTTDETKVFKSLTLKEAQKAGLINVEYDEALGKWIRHSEKCIETDKVAKLNGHLKNFWEQAATSGKSLEKVISKTKMLKGLSVFTNLAICSASLSFILPKIQYMIREHRTKTKAAPGIKVYQEMADKNII